jgi:hypothetical protein
LSILNLIFWYFGVFNVFYNLFINLKWSKKGITLFRRYLLEYWKRKLFKFNNFRQKLPAQYLQSYSKIWKSFTKWIQAQLEQERIILVSDFCIFFQLK